MTIDDTGPLDVSTAFEQLGRISLLEHSMESVLQQVCDLATEVFPGDVSASVSIVAGKKPGTAAFAGDLAVSLDETQYDRGQGPCLHAIATREVVSIPDTRTDERWPDYMPQARREGCRSSLSVPLPTSDDDWGAGVNLYAREPRAFDGDQTQAVADRLAAYAGVAVANMHAYQTAVATNQNLQTALLSRAVIDQAKGILMERYKLTADAAFQALVAVSTRSNVKLHDVARHVVTTGELAAPPRR
jgi:GAF domain-containing protein